MNSNIFLFLIFAALLNSVSAIAEVSAKTAALDAAPTSLPQAAPKDSVETTRKAEIYAQGSHKSKNLYHMIIRETDTSSQTEITDLAGVVIFKNETHRRGSELISYQVEQRQLDTKASIEAKEGQLIFSKTVDGKTKTEKESLDKSTVVPGNFNAFILEHWSELQARKKVSMRYAVWDRMESIGFSVQKVGDDPVGETPAMRIKLKPTSVFIQALVEPIFISYTPDGKKILLLNGRVDPKVKDGTSWKDLDAEVYYE